MSSPESCPRWTSGVAWTRRRSWPPGGAGRPGGRGGAGSTVPVPRRPRPVTSYVKISDGCDRRCAYCAIPLIKGDYETAPPPRWWPSARAALAAGARELVLVGQDTSRWARPGWGGLERLLAELKALEPAPAWLRLLYLQPDGLDDALLEAIARYAVPYVDVPLQHASGAVLRRMGRRGDGEAYLELLSRVRAALPGVAVRSTFIAGFPGETEEEFEELLAFVREAGLAAAGVFVYDPQEGTPGATPLGHVPSALAFERAAQLGKVIDETAAAYWQALQGRRLDVLVERGRGGRTASLSAASPFRRRTWTAAPCCAAAPCDAASSSPPLPSGLSGMMSRSSPHKRSARVNLANAITIARILLIPVFLVLLLSGIPQPYNDIAAAAVFIIAAVTDTLDGYVARRSKSSRRSGSSWTRSPTSCSSPRRSSPWSA